MGVVVKPAAGVLDFTADTLKGIGNTASFLMDSKQHVERVRPQRVFPRSKRLLLYYSEGEGLEAGQGGGKKRTGRKL